jgi:hypothetical protein
MSVRSTGLPSSGHPRAGPGGPNEPLGHRRLRIAGSGPHVPRRTAGRRTRLGLRAVSGPLELRADARLGGAAVFDMVARASPTLSTSRHSVAQRPQRLGRRPTVRCGQPRTAASGKAATSRPAQALGSRALNDLSRRVPVAGAMAGACERVTTRRHGRAARPQGGSNAGLGNAGHGGRSSAARSAGTRFCTRSRYRYREGLWAASSTVQTSCWLQSQ